MAMPDRDQSEYTRVFANVFRAELEYIQDRRKSLRLDTKAVEKEIKRLKTALDDNDSVNPDKHADLDQDLPRFPVRPSPDAGLVGLALSGGGIRSATFNLGLLQALAKRNILRYCDYLSTVSGGGYIGSCLSSLLDNHKASVEEKNFPFRFERDKEADERKEVKWLREHSNYLAPNRSFFGWDIWRMISLYLSGLVLTNLVPFSLVILIAYLVHLVVRQVGDPLALAITLLAGSVVTFAVMVVLRGLATLRNLSITGRRWRSYLQARLAAIAAALAVVAGAIMLAIFLPKVKGEAASLLSNLLHGVSVATILGLLAGLGRRGRRYLGLVFRVAWVVLLPVLVAQLLRWLWATSAFDVGLIGPLPTPVVVALALLIVSLFINTNRISLHHFYRDRLSEAYVIKRAQKDSATHDGKPIEKIVSNEPLTLAGLHAHPNGAPYHLINTTLNVPDSKDRYLRGRRADFFLFSKLYCGGESTGYRQTDQYGSGDTRLATALAISGAAASPQMGTSTSPVLRFLMTLLNVRLNRWMPNPDPARRPIVKFWPYYFVKELLGKGRETDGLLNLSDGGHHENLGIYPLIKRGCRYIIASDAGADPDFKMEDLANLLRKVRIDLGVGVEMRLDGLRPRLDPLTDARYTPHYYVVGRIAYPNGDDGVLVYLKTTVTGNEPEDLIAYRRENPNFPDETTADQFFDEAQFESYRKLGELIGRKVFSEEELFARQKKRPARKASGPELFERMLAHYAKLCAEKTTEKRSRSAV